MGGSDRPGPTVATVRRVVERLGFPSGGSGGAGVKTMATPASSAASTTSASRCDPPGWMIARTPAAIASCGPSAKGKKASEAMTAPVSSMSAAARLVHGDPHGVHAAHLARADAGRGQALGQDDRVRAHVLAHPHREQELAPLLLGGRALRDHAHLLARLRPVSRSCTSMPPRTRFMSCSLIGERRRSWFSSSRMFGLAWSTSRASSREARRQHRLHEHRVECAASGRSTRRLKQKTPPYALWRSVASASSKASS